MKTKLATIAAAAAISLGAAFAAAPASAAATSALGTASAAPATADIQQAGYIYRRYCFPTYSYGYRWVRGYYGWFKQYYKVFTGYRCSYSYRYYY